MIRVLWPTIRPEVAGKAGRQWISMSRDPLNIKFDFGVSSSVDATKMILNDNDPKLRNIEFSIPNEVHSVLDGIPGVTHTATRLTTLLVNQQLSRVEFKDEDIVILASDDFEVGNGWDAHLVEQFKDFDGALIVKDGYRQSTNIIPLPVVCGAFLKRLNGVLYNPCYSHFFSDQELFDIVMEIGNVKDLRGTDSPLFSHKHWSFGGRKKDEFDERNNKWWAADAATYERRKNLSLEEKLKLPEEWR